MLLAGQIALGIVVGVLMLIAIYAIVIKLEDVVAKHKRKKLCSEQNDLEKFSQRYQEYQREIAERLCEIRERLNNLERDKKSKPKKRSK
jgi:uncharacterized membrane-anchored protein YhcB (DUF1043 family)